MPGSNRPVGACVITAVILGVGCAPDGTTIAEPDLQFDQGRHAAGGPLETDKFLDVFDVVLPPGEYCPSFAVHIRGENKVIVKVFESHLAIKNNYKATLTILATGFSLEDNGAWTDIVRFDEEGNEETVTTIGSLYRITIPGQGIVAQDTGIITFDSVTGEVLFEGGPHEIFHGTADVCTLLAEGGG